MRRLGAEPADDVMAETFAVAFQRRRAYDLERPDARPWLYGIATNLIRNHRHAEARRWRAHARDAAGRSSSAGPVAPEPRVQLTERPVLDDLPAVAVRPARGDRRRPRTDPGVEMTEDEVDARGRRGVGFTGPRPLFPIDIIDPETYEYLGQREAFARDEDGERVEQRTSVVARGVVDRLGQRP